MVNEVTETDEAVDTAEPESTEEAVQDISAEEIEKLKNRNVAVLTVMMPPGLRDQITSAAQEAEKSAATWAREAFANLLGYTLPPQSSGRARKYATDEERIAANKQKAKDRRDTVNALLKKLKEGEISI